MTHQVQNNVLEEKCVSMCLLSPEAIYVNCQEVLRCECPNLVVYSPFFIFLRKYPVDLQNIN